MKPLAAMAATDALARHGLKGGFVELVLWRTACRGCEEGAANLKPMMMSVAELEAVRQQRAARPSGAPIGSRGAQHGEACKFRKQ